MIVIGPFSSSRFLLSFCTGSKVPILIFEDHKLTSLVASLCAWIPKQGICCIVEYLIAFLVVYPYLIDPCIISRCMAYTFAFSATPLVLRGMLLACGRKAYTLGSSGSVVCSSSVK